jgi:hypothetical protein
LSRQVTGTKARATSITSISVQYYFICNMPYFTWHIAYLLIAY